MTTFLAISPYQASTAMPVRFSVTISGAFQLTGGATMNKTVATALTNKDAFLAHVPAQNSGKWTHFFPNLNLGNLDDTVGFAGNSEFFYTVNPYLKPSSH